MMDIATFLWLTMTLYLNYLQVIEYIQYLQEKVHKYEGPYQVWNQEKEKMTPWVSDISLMTCAEFN